MKASCIQDEFGDFLFNSAISSEKNCKAAGVQLVVIGVYKNTSASCMTPKI